MKPAEVHQAQAKLDQQLQNSPGYVGIAFGCDLYAEFWKAGYIKLGKFSAVGFPSVVLDLPSYGGGRYAFSDPQIAPDIFVVGKAA